MMRWPGFEPGFPPWQGSVLAVRLPSHITPEKKVVYKAYGLIKYVFQFTKSQFSKVHPANNITN